jgi:hypothetical protein
MQPHPNQAAAFYGFQWPAAAQTVMRNRAKDQHN